ncbi:MAG TPA: hypothetical protein VF848_06745 [Steroidobacteraceae bacterium]
MPYEELSAVRAQRQPGGVVVPVRQPMKIQIAEFQLGYVIARIPANRLMAPMNRRFWLRSGIRETLSLPMPAPPEGTICH